MYYAENISYVLVRYSYAEMYSDFFDYRVLFIACLLFSQCRSHENRKELNFKASDTLIYKYTFTYSLIMKRNTFEFRRDMCNEMLKSENILSKFDNKGKMSDISVILICTR